LRVFRRFKEVEKTLFNKIAVKPGSKVVVSNFPLPKELSNTSPSFLQQYIQNFAGYKGWTFICTTGETHIRSSITFVVEESLFYIFYDGQHDFEGNFEVDIIVIIYTTNHIHGRKI
jgi:hypothetical protein